MKTALTTLPESVLSRGGITLTDAQADALLRIARHCASPVEFGLDAEGEAPANMFALKGYAGTGKSTLIQRLKAAIAAVREAEVADDGAREGEIVLCAPTNKATKVLERMSKEAGIGADVMTVYRLLGLALKTKDDQEVIEQVSDGYLDRYSVVVVDEASMVSAELFSVLARMSRMWSRPVVLVGDPCQLPPVGEADSRAFSLPPERTAELTEIVRQAAGNPIIQLSLEVREIIRRVERDPKDVAWPNPSTGHMDQECERGIWVNPVHGGGMQAWIDNAFAPGGLFDEDHDNVRCLAWTNATVDRLNAGIHRVRYGATKEPFVVGEMVALRKPLVDHFSDKVIAHTDTECEISSIDASTHREYRDLDVWKIEMKSEMGLELKVWVPRGIDGDREYKQILEGMAEEAKSLTGVKRRDAWGRFFKWKNEPASLSLAYALTAHRSQGSTFQNVFIDGNDIVKNRDWREAMKLIYVAITRASRCVVLGWR